MNKICNILLIKHSFWLYNHFYIIVTCHKNNFPFTFLLLHVEITTTISVIVERRWRFQEEVVIATVQAHIARLANIVLSLISFMVIGRTEAVIDPMRLQAMLYA